MAVLGWSLVTTIRDFSLQRLQSDLLQDALVADDVLSPLLDERGASEAVTQAVARLGAAFQSRITLVADDGSVLADSEFEARRMDNHLGRPEIRDALRMGTGFSLRISDTMGETYLFVARSMSNEQAVVRIGMPLARAEGLVSDVQRQVAATALVAGIVMAGAGWFVARRIGTSLNEIRRQAAAVTSGELDVFVDPAPTLELGDLGRAFNAMTATLKGSMAELERTRARLEATLADLSDGVIIVDDRGRVVLANNAALEMLAVRGAVVGEPFVQVGRDHELVDLVLNAFVAPDSPVERIIHHGGSGRILQAAARRLDVAEERIGVVVLHDLTELRRLEGMRRDFVANVSHELRTPLTSIRALVETLEAGAFYDPEVSFDFLGRVISEVDRLALLVDELLDLARLESGRVRLSLERVDPESIVQHAIHRLSPQTERAELAIAYRVKSGTSSFVADKSRIDQVLLNLVHNAIKFTPAGGSIELSVMSTDEFVEFHVRDTGVGVNPADLPRLFERFYKADRARRTQGTGLGLAIAKHIVQSHGGTIWAEPNDPAGTDFVFRLPLVGPTEADIASKSHVEPPGSVLTGDVV